MGNAEDDDRDSTAAFELAAGCVAVVVAAFAAAAAFGPAEWAGRVLIMAVAAGLLAAVLRDWRSCVGVVVIAALVYVAFLTHRAGQLSGDLAPWPYTLVIGLAALLGRGQRWVRAPRPDEARTPVVSSRVSTRPSDVTTAYTPPFSVGR